MRHPRLRVLGDGEAAVSPMDDRDDAPPASMAWGAFYLLLALGGLALVVGLWR